MDYHRAVLSRIDPSYYISEELFARERELLFGRLWQFFTLRPLVARHNGFVVRNLGGRSIVVQNFSGELRAFENVCLHRQAPLQWEAEGIRPLVCRYHAWGYGPDGKVDNIPFEEVYRLAPNEVRGSCLPSFPLVAIGNLVFINLSQDPIAIEAQFSPELIESLRASSASYGEAVAVTTFRRKFNWKLAYENLRDGNHPRFVHTKTLAKTFSFLPGIDEPKVADAKAMRATGKGLARDAAMALLPRLSYTGMDSELEDFQPLEWQYAVEPWQPKIGYFNWLGFPNLHIATATGGHAFTIEHHVPVSAGVTDVILYWVMAKTREPYEQTPAVLYANMLGSERVLSEDFEVVEKVQSALHAQAPRAILGDYEGLNMLVESWYTSLMDGSFVV